MNSVQKEGDKIWNLYYSYNKSSLMYDEDAWGDSFDHSIMAVDLIISTLDLVYDDSLKRGSFDYDFVVDGYTKGAYDFYQDVKKYLKLNYAVIPTSR